MDNAMKSNRVLSRASASAYLGVCKTTLDRLNIPRTKVRRRVFYLESVLLQWLEKNTEEREAH